MVVDGKELTQRLKMMSPVFNQAPAAVEYSCVLVSARKGFLRLRATDLVTYMDAQITCKSGRDVIEPKLVPYKPFVAFASTGKELTLEMTEKELIITSGKSKAKLKLVDAGGFVTWPKWDSATRIIKDGTDLIEGIARTMICASTVLVTPVLYNIHVWAKKDEVIVEAADQIRYARYIVKNDDRVKEEAHVLIPLRSAEKIILLPVGKYEFAFFNSMVGVRGEGITMFSTINEGTFPDVEDKLKSNFKATVHVKKVELRKWLSALAAFTDARYANVWLKVRGDKLLLHGVMDAADAVTAIAIDKRKGVDTEQMHDGRFMQTVLDRLRGEPALSIGTEKDPMVIRDTADKNFVLYMWPLYFDQGETK